MNWVLIVAALCANEPHPSVTSQTTLREWPPKLCQLKVIDCVLKQTKMQDSLEWKEKQALLCYTKYKP